MENYILENNYWTFEVENWQRKDLKYNVYVKKRSKMGTYVGENLLHIGIDSPKKDVKYKDVSSLKYEIF